jgi:hypothetical protein
MSTTSLIAFLVAACVVAPGFASDEKYTPAAAPTEVKAAASTSSTASSTAYYVQPVAGVRLVFHGYYAGRNSGIDHVWR